MLTRRAHGKGAAGAGRVATAHGTPHVNRHGAGQSRSALAVLALMVAVGGVAGAAVPSVGADVAGLEGGLAAEGQGRLGPVEVLQPPASPVPPVPGAGAGPRSGFSPSSAILWGSDSEMARDFDQMAATGAEWVRLDFDWPSAEPQRGAFNWGPTDRVVNAARARGMKVIAAPVYTPAWARPGTGSTMYPPADPRDFAAFVRAAVARYGERVKVWEIWNEPNGTVHWLPRPDPTGYARLLVLAAAEIRAVDPTATILSAGLAPAFDAPDGSQISQYTFLRRLYEAGAGGSFDAVGMHPYSFPARPMDPSTSSWNSFYRLPLLYDVMVEHGDGAKKIWSTEFGAPTGLAPNAVSEAEQAAILTEAYNAITQWPWAGPMMWYSARDVIADPTIWDGNCGLVRYDFSAKPALSAFTQLMRPPVTTTTTTVPPTTVRPTPTTPATTVPPATVPPTTPTTVPPTTPTTVRPVTTPTTRPVTTTTTIRYRPKR